MAPSDPIWNVEVDVADGTVNPPIDVCVRDSVGDFAAALLVEPAGFGADPAPEVSAMSSSESSWARGASFIFSLMDRLFGAPGDVGVPPPGPAGVLIRPTPV